MTITYTTEISELINVGEVSGKVGEITNIITNYSDTVDEVLRGECSGHLSEETFSIDDDPLIFNKISPLITSTLVDTSSLSNIVSLAEKKRKEELDALYKAVSSHINDLKEQRDNKYLEKSRLQLFNVLHINDNSIATIDNEIAALDVEIKKYEEKLEMINAERGGN